MKTLLKLILREYKTIFTDRRIYMVAVISPPDILNPAWQRVYAK